MSSCMFTKRILVILPYNIVINLPEIEYSFAGISISEGVATDRMNLEFTIC